MTTQWYSFSIRARSGGWRTVERFPGVCEYDARLKAQRKYPDHIVRRNIKRF